MAYGLRTARRWGFVGVVLIFALYGVVFWRIISISRRGSTNFEILYGLGLCSVFFSHFVVHVGMNIGLLPVTGITMPFMSYGGSHLVTEFLGLGILTSFGRFGLVAHKDRTQNEIVGVHRGLSSV